jgi:thymidylate kinase
VRNGRQYKLIALCGMDGSGKTSVSKRLCSHLSLDNKPCSVVFFGSYFMLEYPLQFFRFLINLLLDPTKSQKVVIDKNGLLSLGDKPFYLKIWPFLVLCDDLLYYHTVLRIRLLFSTVVTDRYFYDRLVGFKYYGFLGRNLLSTWEYFIPSPDLVIVLHTSASIAQSREVGDTHSTAFYSSLGKEYRSLLSDKPNAYFIDTTDTIDKVMHEVISKINEIN